MTTIVNKQKKAFDKRSIYLKEEQIRPAYERESEENGKDLLTESTREVQSMFSFIAV